MEINNVGYVNFQGNKIRKPAETKSVTPESKEAPASANNALGNYGKAFVNMSFKGNVRNDEQNDIKFKELSDEEFEEYKAKLSEKIKSLPDNVQKTVNGVNITKTNIFLADKILSDERFQGALQSDDLSEIFEYANSADSVSAKIYAIDTIKNSGLADDENFMSYFVDIINFTETKADANAKIRLVNEIKDIYYESSAFDYINNILFNTNTEFKADVASAILSDTQMSKNENVLSYLEALMDDEGNYINTKEQAQAQIELMKNLYKKGGFGFLRYDLNKVQNLLPELYSDIRVSTDSDMIEYLLNSNNDICHTSSLSDEDFEKFKRIAKNEDFKNLNSLLNFSFSDITKLMEFSDSDLEKIKNAFLKNAGKISKNADENIGEHFANFIKVAKSEEFKDFEANELSYNILDNNAGYQLRATKEIDSTDNPENVSDSEKTKVVLTVTDTNGKITKSRSEVTGNNVKTRYENGNRTVIINKIKYDGEDSEDISSEIEIINDEKGEPSTIIHTKESDLLKGAYEVKTYNLKDYPQSMDVLEAINDGTIEGGDTLSSVRKLEDGSISYEQNLSNNDTSTKRNYTLKPDGVSYEYSYHINDENGNSLLSLDRSFTKNDDNTTTTIINGKEYRAIFDEDKKIITIIKPDGKKETMGLDKLVKYEDQSDYAKKEFKNQEDMENQFFDFLKTVDADKLLYINSNIENMKINKSTKSSYNFYTKTLTICFNKAVLVHELGHGADATGFLEFNVQNNIRNNQELIDTYNKEMSLFRETHPEEYQKTTEQFSQIGGSVDTGLAELIAEANMLLTTYGNDADRSKTRAFHLIEYFPKTIAKASELLGYNK